MYINPRLSWAEASKSNRPILPLKPVTQTLSRPFAPTKNSTAALVAWSSWTWVPPDASLIGKPRQLAACRNCIAKSALWSNAACRAICGIFGAPCHGVPYSVSDHRSRSRFIQPLVVRMFDWRIVVMSPNVGAAFAPASVLPNLHREGTRFPPRIARYDVVMPR